MKAVRYSLVKFPKLTVLNLTKLGPWEAGNNGIEFSRKY